MGSAAIIKLLTDSLHFFVQAINGDCSRKCGGHQTRTTPLSVRTATPPKPSRAKIVFCGLAWWPHFSSQRTAENIIDYCDSAALMGGGGGEVGWGWGDNVPPPPPPPTTTHPVPVHLLKYLKNAVSFLLETFWQYKSINNYLQNKKHIFSTANAHLWLQ